jgi:hypothetical protein
VFPGYVVRLLRTGSPVLYLVSDDAAWITGIVLDIAGGAVMV